MIKLTSAIGYIDWIRRSKRLQLKDSCKRTHTFPQKISPRL